MADIAAGVTPVGRTTQFRASWLRETIASSVALVRLGVAGVILTMLGIGVLGVMAIPLFSVQDEPSHYGYAAELAGGRLPTLWTPIPVGGVDELELLMADRPENRRLIWTANHPPLFYLATAVPIGVGQAIGHVRGGVRAARLLVLLFAAGAVAATAWVARLLVPSRPDVAVVAAGFAALVPAFVATSSALFNDSLAVLVSTLAIGATITWLVRGPDGRIAYGVVAAAVLAASSRASGLVAVAFCLVGLALGAWIHRRDRVELHRWTPVALVPMALLVIAALGASGWFWLRNIHLYGDLTGAQLLLDRFERKGKHTTFEFLTNADYWLMQQRRLWDPSRDFPVNKVRGTKELWKLTFLPVIGLLIAASRALRHRRSRPVTSAVVGRRVAWVMAIAFVAIVHLSAAQFASQGGGAHARYLWPAVPIMATVMAVGLTALPGARRGVTTMLFFAAMLAANVWGLMGVLKAIVKRGSGRSSLWFGLQAGSSLPWLVVLVSAILCALGLVAVAISLWSLGRSNLRHAADR